MIRVADLNYRLLYLHTKSVSSNSKVLLPYLDFQPHKWKARLKLTKSATIVTITQPYKIK
jgi:hypothetical protein